MVNSVSHADGTKLAVKMKCEAAICVISASECRQRAKVPDYQLCLCLSSHICRSVLAAHAVTVREECIVAYLVMTPTADKIKIKKKELC